MKKIINIFCIVILLCGVVLYAANLEHKYAVADIYNAEYDSAISADIAESLKDKNGQDIIDANHDSNDQTLLDGSSSTDVPEISTIFDNFFDVYKLALANHNNAKYLEMAVNTGTLSAVGSFSGLNVSITGQPSGLMQRSSSGQSFMAISLTNLQIPYINGTVSMESIYYSSGAKYWVRQFGVQKTYTKKTFKDFYHYSLGSLISEINPDTVQVNSFSYDKLSERYTAKITFKQDANGKLLGEDEYTQLCQAIVDNKITSTPSINIKSRSLTFIINKNCQFLAMTSVESWDANLVWPLGNLDIKIGLSLDASLFWTFSYPKTLNIRTYTF